MTISVNKRGSITSLLSAISFILSRQLVFITLIALSHVPSCIECADVIADPIKRVKVKGTSTGTVLILVDLETTRTVATFGSLKTDVFVQEYDIAFVSRENSSVRGLTFNLTTSTPAL